MNGSRPTPCLGGNHGSGLEGGTRIPLTPNPSPARKEGRLRIGTLFREGRLRRLTLARRGRAGRFRTQSLSREGRAKKGHGPSDIARIFMKRQRIRNWAFTTLA